MKQIQKTEKTSSFEKENCGCAKMAILDTVLGTKTPEYLNSHDYRWTYERSKNKRYNQRHIDGIIGDKEGRKRLRNNGYEIREYQGLKAHFESIDEYASCIWETTRTMNRRRKPEYKEQDKQIIAKYEQSILRQVMYLKGLFGDRYLDFRHLFVEIQRLNYSTHQSKGWFKSARFDL
jgi:hypothetical protein